MRLDFEVFTFVIVTLFWLISARNSDRPCSSRTVRSRSLLCVCTPRYCDTITREIPTFGRSHIYVSSEAGLRFRKSTEPLQAIDEDADSDIILELNPMVQFQTIEGFGGAVTDATSMNWKNMNDPMLMDHLIESYCGSNGIEYNMLRVPIGATDFSTRIYAYNEVPEGDIHLSNFTLAREDYEYKLPMIKACMMASRTPVEIMASSWSSPPWLKTNNNYMGYSFKKEYLQTYADYYYKFIENYARQGVPIWGITTSNEPLSGSIDFTNINNSGWTPEFLSEWIVQNIGPTLRNSTFRDVKIILGADEQRNNFNQYWNMLVNKYPETLPYLAGIATQFFTSRYAPGSIFTQGMPDFPGKFVISTAASTDTQGNNLDIGSWERAELYINNIMETLENNVVGLIDWNMALNIDGGPSRTGARVDSPIIINNAAREFYKQPLFYAMGHFSKFIPRGSKRIQHQFTGASNAYVQSVAFLTPRNTIVVVMYNRGKADEVRIRVNNQELEVVVKTKSITSIEIPNV